jgi:thioredoxin-related protein
MRLLRMLAAALCFAAPAFATEVGDDGLHKAPWQIDTFKDLAEDHAEAAAENKRLLLMIEQRGCLYCRKMHEEVFSRPEIAEMLEEDFFVVQLNMFGNVEVTDFDGTALPEKEMIRRWGMLFTPTLVFFGEETPDAPADESAVASMPGAFSANTTRHLFEWVLSDGYDSDEPFQKYHARRLTEEGEEEGID